MRITRCGWAQKQLLLFLAGELSLEKAAAVRDHLRECPRCAATAKALNEAHNRVKSVLPLAVTAPPTLDARVLENIRRLPPRRPSSRFPNSSRLIAGCAVLGLLTVGYLVERRMLAPETTVQNTALAPPPLQLASLRDDYLRWMHGPQSLSVSGSDARQVCTRLTTLPIGAQTTVAPVTFQDTSAHLSGGCWHRVDGQPVAFLAYQWNGQPVALYQTPQNRVALPSTVQHLDPDGHRCYQVMQDGGLSFIVWGNGATQYLLVSQNKPEQLLGLARSAQGTL